MKLYLIDGNSYVYRAFHAIKGLKNSEGFPTNAVYGFASFLLNLLAGERPGFMGVVFDLPAPTFRHEMYPDYKANRPAMPEELREQFPVIKEMVRAFGVSLFEKEGYEADDIIATLAFRFSREGGVFVLSQDKDCLQLACPGVRIMRENKTLQVFDEAAVRVKYGVEPWQFPDCMALCGDSSDNIAGIPGIGWKTAAKLIRSFVTLEELISGADRIESEKLRGAVKDNSEMLLLNKRLVSLDRKVPLNAGREDLMLGRPDSGKVEEIFSRLEFKKLLEKFSSLQ